MDIRALTMEDLDKVMEAPFWAELRQGCQRGWASGLIGSDRGVCRGLFDGGRLLGFVLAELCAGDSGVVWVAWTHEDSRGKGVATFLVTEVERGLKERGAGDVMAFCNAKSSPVMARLGYRSYDQYTEMWRAL